MMPTSSDFGTWLACALVLLADLRHGDHLALVGGRGDGVAIERLHPLGMGERRREAARDVVGDMAAAHRHGVGEDEVAVEEHGDAWWCRRPCR